MKRIFNDRKVLKIYVDEGEYKWVELQAGGNISQWCREKLLSDFDGAEPRRAVREATNRSVASTRPASAEMPTAPTKSCEHGRPKGYNCWQCGGITKA